METVLDIIQIPPNRRTYRGGIERDPLSLSHLLEVIRAALYVEEECFVDVSAPVFLSGAFYVSRAPLYVFDSVTSSFVRVGTQT